MAADWWPQKLRFACEEPTARDQRRLPRFLPLCSRTGRTLGRVPVAGLTAPPRGATRTAIGGAATTNDKQTALRAKRALMSQDPPWSAAHRPQDRNVSVCWAL